MSRDTVLHVSDPRTISWHLLIQKEVPEEGSCELKHVAQCHVTLQCCAGRRISVVCDTQEHNGIYQNKKVVSNIFQALPGPKIDTVP